MFHNIVDGDYVPSFQKVQNVKSTESCGKEAPVEFLSADNFLLLQFSIFPLPGQPLTGAGVFSSDAQEFSAGTEQFSGSFLMILHSWKSHPQ